MRRQDYLFKEFITRDTVMDILNGFEKHALEEIELDRKIDADNYESLGRYKLIERIKQAFGHAFRKNWPRLKCSLDDILRPGKIFWNGGEDAPIRNDQGTATVPGQPESAPVRD
jgi:hypothetical protein